MLQRAVAVVVILVACVLGLQHGAHAMPKAMPPESSFGYFQHKEPAFSKDNECYHNVSKQAAGPGWPYPHPCVGPQLTGTAPLCAQAEVETLCQRCAKVTKSEVVYPLCCQDKEDAREWCVLYLNYGLQSPESTSAPT